MQSNNKPASALKKITAKDVIKGKLEKEQAEVAVLNDDGSPVLKEDGTPMRVTKQVVKSQDLFAVYGEAHGYDTGQTQFGDYVVFMGAFEAVRLSDGERFQSTRVIFPPIADTIALDSYRRVKERDEAATVDFAFIVGVDPDNRAATGYKFTCKPINTGEEAHDPLARLKSSLAPKFAAAFASLPSVVQALGLPAPGDDLKTVEGTATVKETEAKPKGNKAAENA